MLLTKDTLHCDVIEEFCQTTRDYEILTLSCNRYVYAVVYRPPSGNVSVFLAFLDKFLGWVNDNGLNVVLGGDININMLLPSSENCSLMTLLDSNACTNAINTPTRVQKESSTLIDVFITNINPEKTVSGVIGVNISDHLPIFLIEESNASTKPLKCTPQRTFQSVNPLLLEQFRQDLSEVNWDDVHQQTNPDTAYDTFLSLFTASYKKFFVHTPLTNKKARKPWISKHSLELIKQKDALYRHFLRTRDPTDLRTFKTFRNKVTSYLRQAKQNYLHNLFSPEILRRSDLLWKNLNTLLGREKDNTVGTEVMQNGIRMSGQQLANAFNNFFVSVGESYYDPRCLEYMAPRNCKSAFLAPTSEHEIISTFSSFRNSKALDVDDLQIGPVKYAIDIICPALAHIYNLVFQHGTFPARMQHAKVCLVFKAGDKNDFSNYRPISVLPVFSKGLEKLINERMTSFCDKHSIITNSQFGFRKNLSTEYALLTQKEFILNAFEAKLLTLGVFVDFSKAFDRINHATLLRKLDHYGFRGVFYNLIQSYLQFRCQTVAINTHLSEIKPITAGVPQGSILGPLLFILYVNDLVNIAPSIKFVIYADDTTLLLTCKDGTRLLVEANRALSTLHSWSVCNSLNINTTKTKAVLFRAKNRKGNVDGDLMLGTSKIEIVDHAKSLGVIFEEHMVWNRHIAAISTNLARITGVLARLRFYLPTSVKLIIYNSLFVSKLNYCQLVWGNTTMSNITKLHILQKKAVRAISNLPHDAHTAPIFKELCIRAVPQFYNDTLLKRYYAGMKRNNIIIDQLSTMKRNCPVRHTRHADTWVIPLTRTNYGRQLLSFTLPSLLNSLGT